MRVRVLVRLQEGKVLLESAEGAFFYQSKSKFWKPSWRLLNLRRSMPTHHLPFYWMLWKRCLTRWRDYRWTINVWAMCSLLAREQSHGYLFPRVRVLSLLSLRKLGRGLQPNKQLLLKFLCYEFIRLQYFVVLFNFNKSIAIYFC